MIEILRSTFLLTVLFCLIGCNESSQQNESDKSTLENERKEILKCLNNETKAAFSRDYELWKKHWIQDEEISKTYINFADSTHSESIGWTAISGFVKTFIEEHPTPEPVPKLLNDIDVRLYEFGAWVSYEQQDSIRGLKRETRLMEKENGVWKIAGMHTTIYGLIQ